jgi:hypothetical protein
VCAAIVYEVNSDIQVRQIEEVGREDVNWIEVSQVDFCDHSIEPSVSIIGNFLAC